MGFKSNRVDEIIIYKYIIFKIKDMESSDSSWLSAKITQLHSSDADRTVAIVVTKNEIKEVSANVEVIASLAKSKEFR